MKKILFIAALFFISITNYAQALQVKKTFKIKSSGGWDYIAVHNGKLYVSHSTQVNILDENTGDSIGVIPNTTGVHGIAFDDALNEGFTSNGRINTVTVFNLSTNKVTGQIATGQNPDAIMYEPFTKTIITCNGRSDDLSVIDPVTEKVIKTIRVAGKPETAASDKSGNIYVNIEDKNEIVKVDLSADSVVARWSLNGAEGPTGLAIDTRTKRLFAGCDSKLVVMNYTNGNIVDTLPIGEGCDGVAFDNERKTAYASCGEGKITAVKESDENNFKVEGNYTTKRGARTITIDEQKHTLFLPTAEFDASQKTPEGRPVMIPGTFQVLVVE